MIQDIQRGLDTERDTARDTADVGDFWRISGNLWKSLEMAAR